MTDKPRRFTVGFAYNMIPPGISEEEKRFYLNHFEWDSEATINRLAQALEKPGTRVIPLNAYKDAKKGYDIYYELDRLKDEIDIVFNFVEGGETKNREAILPAMMEWLNIPHTGSDVFTLSIGLDKASSIEVLKNYGINVLSHVVFKSDDYGALKDYAERLERTFPLVVKPVGSGTSIGMDQNSVVQNIDELERAVKKIVSEYKQPAIVQEFLAGDEYAVGILGNFILPIMKMDLRKAPGAPKVRDPEVKELDTDLYSCHAKFDERYAAMAMQAAIVHTALGCNDYSRTDFRENLKDKKSYFLEVNSLPGLDPELSDFTHVCELAGIGYDTMINAILYQAVERYQGSGGYDERFARNRVAYLHEFISPVMDSLELYPRIGPSDDNLPPHIAKASFKMVKAKAKGKGC
jgi:D-alanine-D-alanine ligase